VFFSRPRGASRYIPNTQEVVQDLAARLPQLNWSIIRGAAFLVANAQRFNAARVTLAAHGAGCMHVLFMKTDAVFVEIQCRVGINIFHYFELSRVAGVYHMFTAIKQMVLDGPGTHEFPIRLCGRIASVVKQWMAQERDIEGPIGSTAGQICKCRPERWDSAVPPNFTRASDERWRKKNKDLSSSFSA
jgi:hypothetical protein